MSESSQSDSTVGIYHNPLLYAPSKHAQGVLSAKPMKTTAYPVKTRQKRAGEFYGACMTMHRTD